MKRFYQDVTTAAGDGGWRVRLDGRAIQSPAKAPLVLPTAALAAALADEWRAQGDKVVPATMPLMQLAATTVDKVAPARAGVVAAVAAYGGTDLLCYRAAYPEALAARQARDWQPLLDWAAHRYDALLRVTTGIIHQPQDADALSALTRAVAGLDDWRLTGMQNAVAVTGSLVLGLALLDRRIDADTAFALAELDDSFQIERWGEDAEAMARRAAMRADLAATARYLACLEG